MTSYYNSSLLKRNSKKCKKLTEIFYISFTLKIKISVIMSSGTALHGINRTEGEEGNEANQGTYSCG